MRTPFKSPGSAVLVRRGSAIRFWTLLGRVSTKPGPSEASRAGSRFIRRPNQALAKAVDRPAVPASWSAAGFQQSRRIARHQVHFEVDLLPDRKLPKRGDLQRVRDDEHRKGVILHLVDRERDAVERDRAFGRDEAG